MPSRMSSRGSQRILVTVGVLMVLAGIIQFWRLRTVNSDLTAQVVRLELLLQQAEEKSSKIDSQRREAGEDLKKVNANLQELQITKDEEATKCKQLQENIEELVDKKTQLQREFDEEKESRDGELRDMASKLKALQAELAESRRQSGTEVTALRTQLSDAKQTVADAESCRSQLTQAQTELIKCQSTPVGLPAQIRQPGAAAAAVGVPASLQGGWRGPVAPLNQHLAADGGVSGQFQQAAAARGVLPIPMARGSSSRGSTTTSSARPAVADALETLDKPQGREDPVEGAGVLAPPHQAGDHQDQQEEPQEADGGEAAEDADAEADADKEGEAAAEDGDAEGDGLQYPMEGDKADGADALDDHPDTDGEGKDAALIKGLQELSNKAARSAGGAGLPGDGDDGGLSGPGELGGAVPAPDLTGDGR